LVYDFPYHHYYCSCSGVESRLAALTPDTDDLLKLSGINSHPDMPFTFDISKMATTLLTLFNMLNVRHAILLSANEHCSTRALARYFAALADGAVY
jgi:aarF domain-containing kinase